MFIVKKHTSETLGSKSPTPYRSVAGGDWAIVSWWSRHRRRPRPYRRLSGV